MLKDIFITPQVFTEPTINSGSWKDIKYLLENLLNSGYVIGLKRKKWIKETKWNVSRLEPKVKDHLMALITVLNDMERIVDHPISESGLADESDWLKLALQLHEQRRLYSIFSTRTQDNILTPEYLEKININEKYGITGSQKFVLTPGNIEKILVPFLSYAKRITVIDPYFYIHESRYEDSLRIIAKLLGERRGEKQSGLIRINCKWAGKINNFKQVWKNTMSKLKKESCHSFEINCWEEKDNSIKMHDRYLITNQYSGLVSAAGTNIDEHQQSEWSIKDHREVGAILTEYKENSSPFKLKYQISTEK